MVLSKLRYLANLNLAGNPLTESPTYLEDVRRTV